MPLEADGVDIVATFEESRRCYLISCHEGKDWVKEIRTLAPSCRKAEALDSMNVAVRSGDLCDRRNHLFRLVDKAVPSHRRSGIVSW